MVHKFKKIVRVFERKLPKRFVLETVFGLIIKGDEQMVHKRKVEKSIKELNREYLFWGNIPDVLEKNKVFDKKDIKKVLDELGIRNTKARKFVYEQMELRRKLCLKK